MDSIRGIPLIRNKSSESTAGLTVHDGAVPYFTFPIFDRAGLRNGFSTKFGGVSEGFCAEMNLAALREPANIIQENYRRICGALDMPAERAVLSWQSHTTNVRVMTEEDAGKGPFFERDYRDVDGMITDVPDLPLVTLYADCVPLYFYDPVRRCIGLSHAGWRGTVNRMAEATVRSMHLTFGSDPADILCAIGPSICGSCYEVSADVAEAFRSAFSADDTTRILRPNREDHFLLDLREANRLLMLDCGIRNDRIDVTDICTKCNPGILFSHRVTGEKRGLLGAFLCL